MTEEQTWTTTELQEDFNVIAFMAPWVEVRRKTDGVVGYLKFSDNPRKYYNFVPLNSRINYVS